MGKRDHRTQWEGNLDMHRANEGTRADWRIAVMTEGGMSQEGKDSVKKKQ